MTTDLKSQLTLLKSLQDIDVVLHQIETELFNIPIKVETAAREFNMVNDFVASKQAEKALAEKQKRDEEGELEAMVARVRERETKLFSIKTNKEYQAAIKEIADAKQANNEREEKLIGVMEKIDVLTKEIAQLSAGLADKESAFREQEKELRKGESGLIADKEKLLLQRAEAEKGLDSGILKKYKRVQSRFPDALAVVVSGICGGCNKRIPPQVYIELQKWKELINCPNCQRLLVFEDKEKDCKTSEE